MAKFITCFAAINGFLAVMIGAFGAHGLKGRISDTLLAAYNTGVQYHFYHTLVLLGLGLYMLAGNQSRLLVVSSGLFMMGLLLFCGSLYFLALGGPRWIGPITPLGGLSFMAGWLVLAIYFFRLTLVER